MEKSVGPGAVTEFQPRRHSGIQHRHIPMKRADSGLAGFQLKCLVLLLGAAVAACWKIEPVLHPLLPSSAIRWLGMRPPSFPRLGPPIGA